MEEPLPQWVQQSISKKTKDKQVVHIFLHLMMDLHLGYEELLEMPIPTIFALTEELTEYNKRQEREMKRARR